MPDDSIFGQDPEQFRAKVKMVEEHIAARPVEEQEIIRKTMLGDLTREQAVAWGKAVGEDEADRRRETGALKNERVKRAMAYAAWEFDGKPLSSKPQREEFGVEGSELTPSLQRALSSVPKP